MEAPACPVGSRNAPAPGGGGAAAQVGQMLSLGSGVLGSSGSDCSLAGAGTEKGSLGPRIQLWEAGFSSQTVTPRKAMDQEKLKNFKELQAKFQKLDGPSLSGPIKSPAGVSQKGNIGRTQSMRIWANGKPLSSDPCQPPPDCSSGEPQQLKCQKMKLTQRSEIQRCSDSPGSPERSEQSAVNSRTASQLSDVNTPNAEITDKTESLVSSSFRDMLWNWEKVSSQKSDMSSAFLFANCESRACHLEDQKSKGHTAPAKKLEIEGSQTLPSQMHISIQRKSRVTPKEPTFLLSQNGRKSLEKSSPERSPAGSTCQPVYERELVGQAPGEHLVVRHHQLPKTKPLPSAESLGPPPTKPLKPPAVNLQAFQRQTAAASKTHKEAMEEGYLPAESAEFEEPHHYEATISYLRHSGKSINWCFMEEMANSTYEVRIEELQKPWKSLFHQELSPKREDEDKKVVEKEPWKLELQETEKALCSNHHFLETGAGEETPGKVPGTKVHRHTKDMLARKQDAVTDNIQTGACPDDRARHFQGQCGYVKALEVTTETPGQGACKPSSISDVTYDDVEYPGKKESKSNISNFFASVSEENSKEMYEDVYKTKSNSPKIEVDGKTLKRLQRFFKKEKDRFKMKKIKSKENISACSVSLPNLECRSQEIIIHDDMNRNEKESKNEDKVKKWKSKFFKTKEKKEKSAEESESLSPRNFFRIKKQNLEKKRLERENLFRERFEYDKEITVINTAVACSSNSRNGIFDLPITRGEELEVIDTTEGNLVVCRNSEGKYGYVLIEHLNFKHQGWSP
ncbi:FYN-binding protein 2 isoform X2 [Saccopteryx bilineata]|uniref:FYN-binding protein 2 isoform X2 n=1 Tax=Saccopteryx bilineata TaxID=59482 RepID=UPI00338E358F